VVGSLTSEEILKPISLNEIRAARERITGIAIRTPLVRIEIPGDSREIWLKLENLQPIGSFKIRGAANAMGIVGAERLAAGVYTASAGNMAQGVAYCARKLAVPCTVIAPDRAPQIKIDAIERLGARVIKVPFDTWWQTMVDHRYAGIDGLFVHPFEDPAVMAGNGTIGLELLEDLNDVDAVIVPWGGGGLACGIASAVRALHPQARVYPVEVDTATPLTASFAAGRAVSITPKPSFVDGMGGKSVFEEMWPVAAALVERPFVVSVAEIAAAIRLLMERVRIVAEGAGAATIAAALGPAVAAAPNARKIVCIISGGNIDSAKLAMVLRGETP
jgi:threonine dehydratase